MAPRTRTEDLKRHPGSLPRPVVLALVWLALLVMLAARADAEGRTETPAFAGARVGDWIEHRTHLPGREGTTTVRQVIKEITDDKVIVSVTTSMDLPGLDVPAQTQDLELPRFVDTTKAVPPLASGPTGEAAPARETIEAADGNSYPCQVHQVVTDGKTVKTWRVPEMPFGGVVRMDLDGVLTQEMTGWGRGSAAPPEAGAQSP